MIISTSFTASGTPALDTDPRQTKAAGSSPQASSGSDTVHLSQTAQVAAMHHGGMSAQQIAANLGITIQDVNTDLGITTVSSTASAAAPPSSSQASSTSGV